MQILLIFNDYKNTLGIRFAWLGVSMMILQYKSGRFCNLPFFLPAFTYGTQLIQYKTRCCCCFCYPCSFFYNKSLELLHICVGFWFDLFLLCFLKYVSFFVILLRIYFELSCVKLFLHKFTLLVNFCAFVTFV